MLTLYHTIPLIMTLKKKPFENIVGKAEHYSKQHLLLSRNVLFPSQTEFLFLTKVYFDDCKCFEFGTV